MVGSVPGNTGTLSEPKGTPEPRFALAGTVNWMRALVLLCEHRGATWPVLQRSYATIERAGLCEAAINTVFEQLLMSLHHLAALRVMADARADCNLVRSGIVTWYYGVYCAATAMVAAQTGTVQDDHTGSANQWDRQIAARGLAVRPFDFRLTTLLRKDAEPELTSMRGGSTFTIANRPATVSDAIGACISYLSGTREYREWKVSEGLQPELRRRKLSGFRTKVARQLRDDRLRGKTLGFVHQAFRYRGKANYRDALFLTYEAQVETMIDGFLRDMQAVLRAFLVMAGAFCARRIGEANWRAFVDDLESHLSLAVMPDEIWS